MLIPKMHWLLDNAVLWDWKGIKFYPFHSHNAALSNNQCHDNALLGINNMAYFINKYF